jgi:hypothetical protein
MHIRIQLFYIFICHLTHVTYIIQTNETIKYAYTNIRAFQPVRASFLIKKQKTKKRKVIPRFTQIRIVQIPRAKRFLPTNNF